MKIRNGYVSNSSSSSFIIRNKTDKDLTLVDFVKENPDLVTEFNREYDYGYTYLQLLECAINRDEIFPANSEESYVYGDEDGDVLGAVFDYILRDGGSSESFEWGFGEFYR